MYYSFLKNKVEWKNNSSFGDINNKIDKKVTHRNIDPNIKLMASHIDKPTLFNYPLKILTNDLLQRIKEVCMRVLIIGGEGYIGSKVKEYLIEKKFKVLSFDNLIYPDQDKKTKQKNYFIKYDLQNKIKIKIHR